MIPRGNFSTAEHNTVIDAIMLAIYVIEERIYVGDFTKSDKEKLERLVLITKQNPGLRLGFYDSVVD